MLDDFSITLVGKGIPDRTNIHFYLRCFKKPFDGFIKFHAVGLCRGVVAVYKAKQSAVYRIGDEAGMLFAYKVKRSRNHKGGAFYCA